MQIWKKKKIYIFRAKINDKISEHGFDVFLARIVKFKENKIIWILYMHIYANTSKMKAVKKGA